MKRPSCSPKPIMHNRLIQSGIQQKEIREDTFFWAVQALCTLHRQPFSLELATRQLATPYSIDALQRAAQDHGFDTVFRKAKAQTMHKEPFPLTGFATNYEINHPVMLMPEFAILSGREYVALESRGSLDAYRLKAQGLIPENAYWINVFFVDGRAGPGLALVDIKYHVLLGVPVGVTPDSEGSDDVLRWCRRRPAAWWTWTRHSGRRERERCHYGRGRG